VTRQHAACAQDNYKTALEVHPDELSDDVKLVFDSALGSSACVKLSTEVSIKTETMMESSEEESSEEESSEEEPFGEVGTAVNATPKPPPVAKPPPAAKPQPAAKSARAPGTHWCVPVNKPKQTAEGGVVPRPDVLVPIESTDAAATVESPTFLVFGEPPRKPLGERTNSTPTAARTELSAEEQLRVAQERVAQERAAVKADAAKDAADAAKAKAKADAAKAKADAAKAKADAAKADADAAADAAAAAAVSKERADELWRAKVVFAKDMPKSPLPAFDFGSNAPIGKLVLIPAKKYPKYAASDSAGQDGFMGWAGKLVGYESAKSKMKVKIHGDSGYEHLPTKGSGAYALPNLIRLI
jgi:hypothetical protein